MWAFHWYQNRRPWMTLNQQGCRALTSALARLSCSYTYSASSLIVSRTRLSTVGDRAFPITSARVWNSLPDLVTSAPSISVSVFWSQLKPHLFNSFYPSPCDCTVPVQWRLVGMDTLIVLHTYLLTYNSRLLEIICVDNSLPWIQRPAGPLMTNYYNANMYYYSPWPPVYYLGPSLVSSLHQTLPASAVRHGHVSCTLYYLRYCWDLSVIREKREGLLTKQ